MGGCGQSRGRQEEQAALEASEYELRLETDDQDDPTTSVRAYGLETAGALLARQVVQLGIARRLLAPDAILDGLQLEFSCAVVPHDCRLREAGIMEVRVPWVAVTSFPVGQGATVRVLGVAAWRQKRLVRSDADMRTAVLAWLKDPVRAAIRYGHITTWDVSNVTEMGDMFRSASSFNQDLSRWDVSAVTRMQSMFQGALRFDQDLSGWDVSNVTEMDGMFQGSSSFNQDVSHWDVSNVTTMRHMFDGAKSFNQDLSGWDVSNVSDMRYMFEGARSFNQSLNLWDVSSVTDMACMFKGAVSFNQDLSAWDVSNVTTMYSLFANASSFNQDLSSWDVSSVTNMCYMFSHVGDFNQDLSGWDVRVSARRDSMFTGTKVTTSYTPHG